MTLPPVSTATAQLWQRFQELNRAGRRSQAAEAMAAFIDALSADERVAFTRWLCRRRYGGVLGRRMRSHLMPLARDVLLPVLMEGARRGESECLRCLVHVRFDWGMRTDVITPELHARSRLQGLLAAAIARDPDAADLWRSAFHFELSAAEWGMHHLGEGVLILPERECRRSLERARHILDRAPSEALTDQDRDDLEALDTALTDYSAWKDSGTESTFTEWCQHRGRRYVWPVPLYYDAGRGVR